MSHLTMEHTYVHDDFKDSLQNSMKLLASGSGEEKVKGLECIVGILKSLNREFLMQYRRCEMPEVNDITNIDNIYDMDNINNINVTNDTNDIINVNDIKSDIDAIERSEDNLENVEKVDSVVNVEDAELNTQYRRNNQNQDTELNISQDSERFQSREVNIENPSVTRTVSHDTSITLSIQAQNSNEKDVPTSIENPFPTLDPNSSTIHTPPFLSVDIHVPTESSSNDTPKYTSRRRKVVTFPETDVLIEILPPTKSNRNSFGNNFVCIRENFNKDWKEERERGLKNLMEMKGLIHTSVRGIPDIVEKYVCTNTGRDTEIYTSAVQNTHTTPPPSINSELNVNSPKGEMNDPLRNVNLNSSQEESHLKTESEKNENSITQTKTVLDENSKAMYSKTECLKSKLNIIESTQKNIKKDVINHELNNSSIPSVKQDISSLEQSAVSVDGEDFAGDDKHDFHSAKPTTILEIEKKRFKIEQQLQQEYVQLYWSKTSDIFVHIIRTARRLLVHRSSYIRAATARVFKYLILLGLDEECWKFGVDALLFRMFDIPSGKEKEQALFIAYSLCEPHIKHFPPPIMKGLMNVCLNPKDRFRTMALEILCHLLLLHPHVAFLYPNAVKIIVHTATVWSMLSEQHLGVDKSPSGAGTPGDIDIESGIPSDNLLERPRSSSNSVLPSLSIQMRENACQTLVHILDHYYYKALKDRNISTEKIQAFSHSVALIIHPFLDHLSWPNKTDQELIRSWKQSHEALIHLSMHWSGVFYMGTNFFGPLFQSILLPPPSEPTINPKNKRPHTAEEQGKLRIQFVELNNVRINIILDIIIGILRVACPKYLVSSLIPDSVSVNSFGNNSNDDPLTSNNHEFFGESSSRSVFNPTPQRKDIINQYMAIVLRAMIRNYILEILHESGKTIKRSNAVLQVILSLIDAFLGTETTIKLIQGFDLEYSKVLSYQMEDLSNFTPLQTTKNSSSWMKAKSNISELALFEHGVILGPSSLDNDSVFQSQRYNTPSLVQYFEKSHQGSEEFSSFNISSCQRKLYALLGEVMRQNRLDYSLSSYFRTTRSRLANLYLQTHKRKNSCVGNIGTNTLDTTLLNHLIKESQVPNKDVKKWEWDIIMELMRYRLPDQDKFLKRILTFFRPKKKIFSILAFKDSHMKYCEVGCQLLRHIILAWYPSEMNREQQALYANGGSNSMIPSALSQILGEIVETIYESSEEIIATTMTRTYFDMLGVLSQYPQGIILLKEHKIFSYFKNWVEGQRHDIAQLCLKNLSYKFKDSPSREILVSALHSRSNKTRYYATLRLKSLIQSISDFEAFGIHLLYERSQDHWPEVAKNALRILHEACAFDEKNFKAFLSMRPNIDALIIYDEKGSIQQQSLQLVYFILRNEEGLTYVQEHSPIFIQNELLRWETVQTLVFAQQLEQIISRTIKSNMNKSISFIRSHMRVTGSSSVLPNIYASLVRTTSGCEIVKQSTHAHAFIGKVVELQQLLLHPTGSNQPCLSSVDIYYRTSLWMLAFIGQHDKGMNMLLSINENILEIVLQLAEEAPFSSVRGIMFYCISLLCRGSVAREYFRSRNWIVDERSFTALPIDDGKLFDMILPEGQFSMQLLNQYTFYHSNISSHSEDLHREVREYDDEWTLAYSRKLCALKSRLVFESKESSRVLDIVLRATNPVHQKEALEKLSKMKEENIYIFKDPRLYMCSYIALGSLTYSTAARNTIHKIFDGWNVSGLGFDWYDETVLDLVTL